MDTKQKRNYKEENQKHFDKNIEFRTYEDKDYIKVSPTVKGKIHISIHPYLKEQFAKIANNSISADIEEYIKNRIESELKKKIILKKR